MSFASLKSSIEKCSSDKFSSISPLFVYLFNLSIIFLELDFWWFLSFLDYEFELFSDKLYSLFGRPDLLKADGVAKCYLGAYFGINGGFVFY